MTDQKKNADEKSIQKRLDAQRVKESIINHIVERADELTNKQKNKKKEDEIIELLGGGTTSISLIKRIIASALQNYSPIYPRLFYTEIYRLNNWPIKNEKYWQKPHKVAVWTNELIYMRFSKEVLPTLQHINPFIAVGIRANYHYQWLTPEGKQHAERFIADAIRVMQSCSTWMEFTKKYATEFKLPYQTSLFD